MLVGAGALDSPLEVTRFEFTIKSCRCTKTCGGSGRRISAKQKLRRSPTMLKLHNFRTRANAVRPYSYLGKSYLRKIAPLYAYLRFAMG